MFVVKPRIFREAMKVMSFKNAAGEQSVDVSCDNFSVEIPRGVASVTEDPKKTVKKAKPGDRLTIEPKIKGDLSNRIVIVECNPLLYANGVPVFQRVYTHGASLFGPISWECTTALDLDTVEPLYNVYIVDEHVR